jgi:chloride channel protein, CIC family
MSSIPPAVARDPNADITAGSRQGVINRIARSVSGVPDGKLICLAILIGAVSGGVAIALYAGVGFGTHVLVGSLGYHPATVAGDKGGFHPASGPAHWARWLLPLLTAAGALVATTIVYLIAPETHGHGTDNAIKAINTAPSEIRARAAPIRLIASVLTIGSGGSGGTEGPVAQMAATTASVIAKWLQLDYRRARMMVTAGLAAGVGAIFRAPLGGAMLGVEILFRDDADPVMLVPSMVASFAAYLVFGTAYGFSPMFGHVTGINIQLSLQLVAFPLVGLCAGVLARLFCWGFYALVDWFATWTIPRPLRAACAGLAVGVIGLYVPGVLGTGYGTIQEVLSPQHVLSLSILVLIAMPLAKVAATALTVGSGGSAGVFGPGMVIGATAGAALWRLLHPLGLAPSSPAALVIIGMAACLGAASHAPVAITLIAAEACGNISLVEPAVIAVPIAVLVVGRRTLYQSQPATRAALDEELTARLPAPDARAPDSRPGSPPAITELTTVASKQANRTANPSRTRYSTLTGNPSPDPVAPVLSEIAEGCAAHSR